MPVGSQKILDELADHISHKQNLYRSCYSADLKRVETTYDSAALTEVLARIDERNKQREAGPWDKAGHRDAVEAAVDRLLQRAQPQDHRFR